jgi:hypothetical protein
VQCSAVQCRYRYRELSDGRVNAVQLRGVDISEGSDCRQTGAVRCGLNAC